MSTIAATALGVIPSRSHLAIAGAALAAVALAVAAYAGVTRSTTPASAVVPVGASVPDVVFSVVAGIPSAVSPQTALPVGGALEAYVSLDRSGDGPGGRDLRLRLVDAQGKPVEGATIHVVGQMRFMDHGAFDVVPAPDGPGIYIARLHFAMAGEYELRLNVFGGGTTGSVVLDLDLH